MGYHTAGVIGQSYAAAEGMSLLDGLGSLVGWVVSPARGENSYGAGDWREEQQQAEDYGQTTFVLQSVLGYAWIYESWKADLDGDGQADDAWDFGNPHPISRLAHRLQQRQPPNLGKNSATNAANDFSLRGGLVSSVLLISIREFWMALLNARMRCSTMLINSESPMPSSQVFLMKARRRYYL